MYLDLEILRNNIPKYLRHTYYVGLQLFAYITYLQFGNPQVVGTTGNTIIFF